MAEVQQNQDNGSLDKRKKKSTRIDMTAMVDVAFLLLTFFILTTSLANPYVMELDKPVSNIDTPINCKKMMTIYLMGEDKIQYIAGCDQDQVISTDFSHNGIRQDLIREKLQRQDLIISIKPSPLSHFGNLVDLLDEIQIVEAKKYALADWNETDEAFLKEKGLYK